MSRYKVPALGDRLRAQLQHRITGERHAPQGAQKLTIAELRKAAEAKGEHLVAGALDDVVLDRHGNVDLNATIVKFRRRALLGKAAAAASGLAKPVSAGDVNAGPRGSGPAPRTPADMQQAPDRGNANVRAMPVPGVAQHDLTRLDPRHDPRTALEQLTSMVRAAHKRLKDD